MRIDTDIILWNGNEKQKYRVLITVDASRPYMQVDGTYENRKVENQSILQKLLDEFISDCNKKSQEKYLSELQIEQINPTQVG